MVDSNGKPIDTRTTVGGETPGAIVPGSGATTPPASNPPAIKPEGTSTSTKVTTTTRATTPVSTEVPAQYKVSSYAELIPELEKRIAEFKPLTDDELKKLRRRQKAEGIISGISDAVQSVANLMFTRQYAPNMYNPKEGMSAKAKERFEKDKAQREADADKFFNYAMQIGRLKDAENEKGLNIWETEQNINLRSREEARKDAAEIRAQAKADRDAAMAKLRMDLLQGRIDQQAAAAEAERIEADYAEAYWQSRINKNNYRRPVGSGSRGKTPEYPWYDSKGNLHYASSYEAMRQNSLLNGTWQDSSSSSTSTRTTQTAHGTTRGQTTTTTTRPAKGHSTKPQKQGGSGQKKSAKSSFSIHKK